MSMVDWDLIPFAGEKSVRRRLREIDKELVSILVVISIGFAKVFEGFVSIFINQYPILFFGIDFSKAFWWFFYTLFWMLLYIIEADKVVKEKAGEAVEKADEVTDEVKERASGDD